MTSSYTRLVAVAFAFLLFAGAQDANTESLVAVRTATPPKIDGRADEAAWASAPEAVLKSGLSMKAVYDGATISVLATWPDATMSFTRGGSWTWDGSAWSTSPSAGQDEDRLAILWDINATGFETQGCAVACHSGGMWIEATGERADVWHMKAARSLGTIGGSQTGTLTVDETTHEVTAGSVTLEGYADDKYFGQDGGEDRGRYGDEGGSTYARNRNSDATGPLYLESDPEDYVDAMVLRQDEIEGGEVVVIADASTSEIAAAWGKYEALGAMVSERILRTPLGSRSDVLQSATWENGVWTTEYQRALVTGNDDDVQFSDLTKAYLFGAAIYDNDGGISHDMANDLVDMVFRASSVPTSAKARATVVTTVTQDGLPLGGVEVAFSRSVSGHAVVYRWRGTTGSDGEATVEIVEDDARFWRTGASGYYQAMASNSQGDVLGKWGSIPINGGKDVSVSLPIGGPATVGVASSSGLMAGPNLPNPFNPSTQIFYQIAEAGDIQLAIYNSLGQQVKVLVRSAQNAGRYQILWDGTDAVGKPVASGVYIYRLVNGPNVATGRMLMLK